MTLTSDDAMDATCIIMCQGPPVCLLDDANEGEAVKAQKAGCVWCKRVWVHYDGSETVKEPSRQ
jgi:hypothetical protein